MLRPPARPTDLLVYYGWLNSFNSATNQWTNEKVAQDMAKYGMLVFGDGIQDPGHGDYANTTAIITRLRQLTPNSKIFGYVTANQTIGNFQTKTDQWDTLQVDGIMVDEAGYDWGINRADMNTRVDYIHGKTYAKTAFVNAWNEDHIIGTTNDPSYPNSTYNPSLVASTLNENDWYMLESFSVNTASYTGTGGYASASDWKARGDKAAIHRRDYGLRYVTLGVINNDNASGQALFNFSYYSALAFAADANGTSDTNYAAGSAAVTWWTRPGNNMVLEGQIPAVYQDAADSDVYMRYGIRTRVKVDFSTGAQTTIFERW